MNKFIATIFLSFLFLKTGTAQQDETDSLISKLTIIDEDTAKIVILNKLAILLHNKEPEKSLEYANDALEISEDQEYFEHLTDTYSTLAAASWVLSDYPLGLDYLFKKLKIHETKKEYRQIAVTYKHIAIILRETGKDSLALAYINKSLDICKKHKYQVGIADAYNIIANIHFDNYDSAQVEAYWQKALAIYQEENKPFKAASIEHNLGMLFYNKHDYEKALKSFNHLLAVCIEYNDNLYSATALENIGSVYMKTGKYKLAGKYFLQLLDTANKYSLSKVKLRAYFLSAELDMITHNYESAYHNYTKYSSLKDSVFSQENEKKISELQIRYETEKTEKANISLRKEKKINQLIVMVLVVGLFSVILILFFMWRMIKTKQKNNNILTKKNEEILKQKQQILENNEELRIQSEELVLHEEHLKELVEERTKELLMANEKAKESDELKSAFLTNVSHEIRTPMNAIIGFADLLTIPGLSDNERDEYLKVIQGSSNRLLDLINDIIDLSKIEVGKLKINKLEFSIEKVLLKLLSEFSDKKTVNLDLICDNDLTDNETIIFTDQNKFKQIMHNLLDNALKFTDKGSVNFGYRLIDDMFFEFYVKDTGIGIPADKQKIIFDRFRKIEDSTEKLYQGTGLGLTIAKSLTEMLGGQMWLASDHERGSVFKFRLSSEKQEESVNLGSGLI